MKYTQIFLPNYTKSEIFGTKMYHLATLIREPACLDSYICLINSRVRSLAQNRQGF
jgi:hypothetical protein